MWGHWEGYMWIFSGPAAAYKKNNNKEKEKENENVFQILFLAMFLWMRQPGDFCGGGGADGGGV